MYSTQQHIPYKAVSQSCAVAKSEKSTEQSNLAYKWLAATKDSKVWFLYSHNWSNHKWNNLSLLSAKFDCPVARHNCLLLATVLDCETSLYTLCNYIAAN